MQVKHCVCFCRAALESCSGLKRADGVHAEMSSREVIMCGKEENQRKCHISEQDWKSHVPLTEDKARIAEAARQSALEILRDAVKKKDRVLMETPRDLISCDSAEPSFWMERYAVLKEKRVRDLISVLEEAKFMGDPSAQQLYAYVYSKSVDKTIYLCPLFWEAPSHLARGSQPGLLIREASHFLGARYIAEEPDSIDVACKGLLVKNNSTDPDSPKFLPLVNAVLNANNIEYEFEVTLRHRGDYEQGRYSCCGEPARSSVCESAVPDKFFASPSNQRRVITSIPEILRGKLLPARDRLQRHVAALRTIADTVDAAHRGMKKAKIIGGIFGIVGGITTVTGLSLASMTFETSLVFCFMGLGVSLAGGLTSAAAISSNISQSQDKKEKFNGLLGQCQAEVQRIKQYMEYISVRVQRAKEAVNKTDRLFAIPQIGAAAGRAAFNAAKMVRAGELLGKAGHITQLAGTPTRTMTNFMLCLDIFFVAKDSIELLKGTKSDLAAKIRKADAELEQVIEQVNNMNNTLTE
ncbi:uncharacterized protein LOC106723176 [Alligator sinensis]|uniref:Uncharacterized protein LOC106723176 n=1 Tax=Alligator sinensis TaxID=38654 RepID=A0A3Q0FS09_ALLSI|nr:uncharacterized protein LOC106723176 [Alligator sinensis]